MYKLVVLSFLALAPLSQADACPDFSGRYSCSGEVDSKLSVTQNGTTVTLVEEIDGVKETHVFHGEGTQTFGPSERFNGHTVKRSCDAEGLRNEISGELAEGNGGRFEGTMVMSLTAEKDLVITLSTNMNGGDKSVQTCKRR